jgi:hypothetical protein
MIHQYNKIIPRKLIIGATINRSTTRLYSDSTSGGVRRGRGRATTREEGHRGATTRGGVGAARRHRDDRQGRWTSRAGAAGDMATSARGAGACAPPAKRRGSGVVLVQRDGPPKPHRACARIAREHNAREDCRESAGANCLHGALPGWGDGCTSCWEHRTFPARSRSLSFAERPFCRSETRTTAGYSLTRGRPCKV